MNNGHYSLFIIRNTFFIMRWPGLLRDPLPLETPADPWRTLWIQAQSVWMLYRVCRAGRQGAVATVLMHAALRVL